MTFLYLDSSALVKRYVAEPGSDDVIALMADAAAVATSLVTRAEVAAALARAVRSGKVDEDDARRAHRKFLHEWPDIGRVPVTDALVERADALAWERALRGYDAIQLAAALACQDMVGALDVDVLLATFDRQLLNAARQAGPDTWPGSGQGPPPAAQTSRRPAPGPSPRVRGNLVERAVQDGEFWSIPACVVEASASPARPQVSYGAAVESAASCDPARNRRRSGQEPAP